MANSYKERMKIKWIFILIQFSILYQQSFSVNKFLVKTKNIDVQRHYLVQSHSKHNRHKSSKEHKHGSKGGARVARDYLDQGTAKAAELST